MGCASASRDDLAPRVAVTLCRRYLSPCVGVLSRERASHKMSKCVTLKQRAHIASRNPRGRPSPRHPTHPARAASLVSPPSRRPPRHASSPACLSVMLQEDQPYAATALFAAAPSASTTTTPKA